MHLHIKDVVRLPAGATADRREARFAEPLRRLVGEEATKLLLDWAGSNGIRHFTPSELTSTAGVDEELAARIVAARDLFEALTDFAAPRLASARAVVEALPLGFSTFESEVLLGYAMGGRSDVRALLLLAKGGVASAAVTPRDVFAPVLRVGGSALILVHNHPSGDPLPSDDDVRLTNTVTRIGRALGVPLLDHLIVGAERIFSLHDHDLLLTSAELREEVAHG
jgi:DNA repair protein RadC